MLLALSLPLSAGSAFAAVSYRNVSIAEYEHQLSTGGIAEVVINKRLRSLHTTLKNGEHVVAKYGKKEEPKYYGQLQARRIHVSVLTPAQADKEGKEKTVHHKLRYIAGAVIVVVVLIVGGVLFYNRRRKAVLD